ncbi:hypothetical protein BZA05DRAFT_274900 [Tricharina praecox]|uniref:uncharacterized protein n=1 Tax=Tricharina praecox TaxID=43433 RepID=UPI00221F7C93|nr:uncharacterized protein BZA05DRAFT_274900 [Tricharina praecox]KAI5853941.1 hypothetical protein BZA05DRAFT_274900 [Tricharina praecox]
MYVWVMQAAKHGHPGSDRIDKFATDRCRVQLRACGWLAGEVSTHTTLHSIATFDIRHSFGLSNRDSRGCWFPTARAWVGSLQVGVGWGGGRSDLAGCDVVIQGPPPQLQNSFFFFLLFFFFLFFPLLYTNHAAILEIQTTRDVMTIFLFSYASRA